MSILGFIVVFVGASVATSLYARDRQWAYIIQPLVLSIGSISLLVFSFYPRFGIWGGLAALVGVVLLAHAVEAGVTAYLRRRFALPTAATISR